MWDEFFSNTVEPLPPNRPVNGLFDFKNDFGKVPPMYHLFDWGPLPDDRTHDTPDAHVLRSVANFLRRRPKEPFFCAAGFYKPHLPWHAPKSFFDLYDPDRISLPFVKLDDLDDVPPIAQNWALSPPDHELVTSRGQWRLAVQAYLASISYVDSLIGELIATLDQTGLSENTCIILWGDNGFHLGEKLHWRKFVLWEEATRVPLIVVPAGARNLQKRIYEPTSLLDLFPTLAELAELPLVKPTDGVSLLTAMTNRDYRREAPVVMTWGKGNHSIRKDRWRYTIYADGSEELYDHNTDPCEWTNIASDRSFSDIRRQLRASIPVCPSSWASRDDPAGERD